MRILVATEDGAERAIIRDALATRPGVVDVIFVADGLEAYLAFRRERPDVAVVSAALPRMDGMILVRTATRSPDLRSARTILVLSPSFSGRVREALEARPSGLLVRPFGAEDFLERLDQVLALDGAPHPVPISRRT